MITFIIILPFILHFSNQKKLEKNYNLNTFLWRATSSHTQCLLLALCLMITPVGLWESSVEPGYHMPGKSPILCIVPAMMYSFKAKFPNAQS